MKPIQIGIIGLGGRGQFLLSEVILAMDNVVVAGVCDLYEDRTQKGYEAVLTKTKAAPVKSLDYHDVLAIPHLDAVVISTSWETHIPIAIDAMKAGVRPGVEVGAAYSLDQLWQLVRTSEETGVPCMLLENCCYGRDEMMIMNMVRQGIFGSIVHCQGGYRHDLRDEISYGRENRHYRNANYKHRNAENYPTHELGPIAQILNINHGNRMLKLTSTASCARGLNAYLAREKGPSYDLTAYPFAQGDVVTTTITCAHGETIVLTLDTTLPRYYSRGFHIQGTLGMYEEENQSIFIDGVHNQDDFEWHRQWGNIKDYREQYEHPVWKSYLDEGVRGGHGGMDYLVLRAFFESVATQTPPPIDVYDMAAWMSIGVLSEQSIALGGAPVMIPDFTNGRWIETR